VLLPQVGEHASSVEDGGDLNEFTPKPVDQAVGAHDEFTNVGFPELRNNAAQFRELDEAAWCSHETGNHEPRVQLRVVGDVLADGLEVGARAATSSGVSGPEAPLHFFVRDALAGIELREPFFDPGHEHKTLDRVIDRRVGREAPKRLENPFLAGGSRRHVGKASSCSPVGLTPRFSGGAPDPSAATGCWAAH